MSGYYGIRSMFIRESVHIRRY